MNLLVLSPWFPSPPDNGSRLRAFHLLREWARAGHSIRLVTGLQEDIAGRADESSLRMYCDSVAVFPWRWHDGTARSPLGHLFSVVPRSIVETENPALRAAMETEFARKPDACIAMELAAAPYIPQRTNGVPVVLEQVEVSGVARSARKAHGMRGKLNAALTFAKHRTYWRRELKRFDAITAVSREEADAVFSLLGSANPPVIVAPNGVDAASYSPEGNAPVPGRILYNGSLTYGPNREAVTWFAEEILPRIARNIPEAHLMVTGTVPQDALEFFASNSRVHFSGFVPDIRPVLATAMICAVPLIAGGGTRLKILEAWAAGIPVVSTRIGASGLAGSVDGTHLCIADAADSFADACTTLLTHPELRQRLIGSARRLVEERYNWTDIARQITDLAGELRGNNSNFGGSQRS